MKKLIVIIILCGVGYFCYKNIISDKKLLNTSGDNEVTIESAGNKFIGEVVSGYNRELRIYGINHNDSDGWSPIAYADFIFVASPYKGDSESCEANSAAAAPLINIIVENEEVVEIINELEKTGGRRRATIIGEKIHIKKFFFKGEDHSDALEKQGKINPQSAIWVDEIIL